MIPPKPDDVTWNDEQWQAIYANKPEILISAGAGSGKTAVLVERIMQRVLQAQQNVDELLVLTFTEAAAAEMKQRIRERIEDELQKQPNHQHLNRQLGKILRAQISTFHAFCNQLIKGYYYLLGIDPAFKIADDIEIGILQDEVLETLFDHLNEVEDENFLILSDRFNGDRHDEQLKIMLLKIYELARSNPDMIKWLKEIPQLYHWDQQDLQSWSYYEELVGLIKPALDEAKLNLEKARNYAIESQMTDTLHKYPAEVYPQDMSYCKKLLEANQLSYEQLRETFHQTKLAAFPRLNKKNFDEESHGFSKAARDEFKKQMDKVKQQFFIYSNDTHKKHFTQNQQVIKALVSLVLQFHKQFQEAKAKQQLLDFSDLEWYTLTLLLKDNEATEVAKAVYHQYQEIMIDEYQDTNSMQERIVSAIAKVEKPPIPIFMVGDVKQSIYRFRLAEPAIFQGKYQAFSTLQEEGLKIDLMKNYRSHQQIIAATNYIFKQLMDVAVGEIEYDEAAKLKIGVMGEENDEFHRSELHLINKQFDEGAEDLNVIELEAHHMARTILGFMENKQMIYNRKKNAYCPITYQDIVILMRSLSHVTIFQDVFRLYNIPLFTEQNTDLFDSVEIINILSCLKVIDNPYQDIPLVGLMRSPLFFFTEQELAMIKVEGKGNSFYNLVLNYQQEGTDPLLKEKVTAFRSKIERWRYDSKMMPISQLISLIYEQSLYYEFVLGLPHGILRKANLDVFLDRARGYEQNTKRGLYRFINYIERMQALGKHFGKAKTVTANEDVVRIMTIHKSKGLEFPIVFISQIHKRFNQQDELGSYVMHKKYGVAVKYIDPILRLRQKTIVGNVVAALIHKEMLAEEMRLLYVAMTRAKSKLIFTGVIDLEKKLTSYAQEAQETSWLLSASYRLKAKSYADWLLPAIFRNPSVQSDIADIFSVQPTVLDDLSSWKVKFLTEHEALATGEDEKEQEAIEPPAIDLEKAFHKSYPFETLLSINAKQSISQRKEEESTPMFAGIPELKPAVAYDRPSFMNETKITGAEVGTALHHFMQHLPLRTDFRMEDLQSLRQRLIEQELIKEPQALQINLQQVLTFTKSSLFGQLIHAAQIKREAPFMTLVSLDDHQQAQVLLQGVIDLLAEFEDEVWIIDYKTDYVKDFQQQIEQLRERYAVQMKYYLKAMKDIYPSKYVTCHVYFLQVGQSIVYS